MNTSFGETLRTAREAKGLTTSQIASKTRMLVQIVEEMENEDFHRIAAPIYGRGFVKLYAECVDLDPQPLVKEFMEIYEGRRAPIVRTRDVPVTVSPPEQPPEPPPPEESPEPPPVEAAPSASVPEPIPAAPPPVVVPPLAQVPEPPPVVMPPAAQASETLPEPSPEPPPVIRGLELFDAAPSSQAKAESASTQQHSAQAQPPPANVADIFSDSPYLSTNVLHDSEGPSAADRFRNGLTSVSHGVIQTVREIPRNVWRITALVLATILLLGLLVWGCIALYKATSITPAAPETNGPKVSVEQNDFSGLAIDGPANAKGTKEDHKGPNDLKEVKVAKPPKDTKPAKKDNQAIKRPKLRSTGQNMPSLYAD